MKMPFALLISLIASTAQAEAPVPIPEGFEVFSENVDGDNALYSYRRGTVDVDEQSIVIFRNRFGSADDPQLPDAMRQLLASDCADGEMTYADLAENPPFIRGECAGGFVAYARVMTSDPGICVVGVGMRQAAVALHELPLRNWIDGLEECPPEEAWVDG